MSRPRAAGRQRARGRAPEEPQRVGGAPAAAWLTLAAMLFFAPAISSLAQKSATYDEPVYVIAGLSYLTLGEFTLKDDAPPLVAYLAGLSPRAHGLAIPGGALPFRDSLWKEYPYAKRLLYRGGADADRILFWSRLAVLLPFGMLLLVSVQRFAAGLFGARAGIAALLLAALSPNLVAHGRLVATDLACAASMLYASYRLWRFCDAPTGARAIGAGLALGLALVTKFTALLLLPGLGVALLAWLLAQPRTERSRAFSAAALVAFTAALPPLLVYGPEPDALHYASGVARIYRNVHAEFPWFAFGSFHEGGARWYYLAALAAKTSLPLLGLGIAGLVSLHKLRLPLWATASLLLPPTLLLVASAFDASSSGLRRVLPVLPVLAVLGGSLLADALRPGRARVATVAGLIAILAASSFAAWPHYIPYYNEITRAVFDERSRLDDSSIDWGQDLKALPAVMRRHAIPRVDLWYFGEADPRYYRIRARRVRVDKIERPRAGVYAVSLHYLIRLQLEAPKHWLLRLQPFERAGSSILLFRVEAQAS